MHRDRFVGYWPLIREELIQLVRDEGMPEDAAEWFRRSLDYNTPGGKLNRGLSVIDTLEILRGRPLTDREFSQAAILGWCVELLQAYYLVADDIMDQSVTRRGQPCWFRVEDVGSIAVNDAFMVTGAISFLLRKHFRCEPYYPHLIELFDDINFKTELGQLIDMITAPENRVDLSKFSLARHRLIVVYKTSYYSFYLPVALGMRLAGLTSPLDQSRFADSRCPPGVELFANSYQQTLNSFLSYYDNVIGRPSWLSNPATNPPSYGLSLILNMCYLVWNVIGELGVRLQAERKSTKGGLLTFPRLLKQVAALPLIVTEVSSGNALPPYNEHDAQLWGGQGGKGFQTSPDASNQRPDFPQQVSALVVVVVQYGLLLFYGAYILVYIPYHAFGQLGDLVQSIAPIQRRSSGVTRSGQLSGQYFPVEAKRRIDPYQQALSILLPIGEYFQDQDDYLDCFAPSGHLGKVGTDIVDNKCSWNINTAIELATAEQRRTLEENYGRKDPQAEAAVKEVFSSPNIDLPSRFAAYEADSYKRISSMIEAAPEIGGMKREVYRAFLRKVYKRTK